jgi:hypothetical protein
MSSILHDKMPCIPVKVNRRFGGSYRSIFRVEKYAKQEASMRQAASRIQLHDGVLLG